TRARGPHRAPRSRAYPTRRARFSAFRGRTRSRQPGRQTPHLFHVPLPRERARIRWLPPAGGTFERTELFPNAAAHREDFDIVAPSPPGASASLSASPPRTRYLRFESGSAGPPRASVRLLAAATCTSSPRPLPRSAVDDRLDVRREAD